MTPDRWRQVEELYHAALSRDLSARAAFLDSACPSDSELRHEVESLLQREPEAGAFLETRSPDTRTNILGRQVGPYRILSLLGAGGMGEVYRAHDSKLGRDVAIKTLPREFAGDPERLARFRREARTLASLNHPNIAAIYGIEESDGATCLVLELVDGPTLCGPVPVEQAVDYARQVAEALEAAHAKGIIHRDLKPANIKVTPQGRVKVLDFGLAKAVWGEDEQPELSQAPTVTGWQTIVGQIAGTPPYMSPEQTCGEVLDGRSDLWSLGVVLYELITGARPFEGSTHGIILEAIRGKTFPPLRQRNPKIPPELERIIGKLLQKDRQARYQNSTELLADLKKVGQPSRATPVKKWTAATTAAIILLGAGAMLWQRLHAAPLTDKDVLVLADFTNNTADPVFDGTLREALAIQIDESPFLKTLSDERVRIDLRLMGKPVTQRITSDIARDICQRENQKAMIGGSIASLGRTYVLTLESTNCRSGDTLARVQAEAPDKEHVLEAVAKAAKTVRQKLGESLQSIQKLEPPKDEVTTTSLQAFQAFAQGAELYRQGMGLAAIPPLQQAVKLDPDFATAWSYLGAAYYPGGTGSQVVDNIKRSFELRDRVTERERFQIDTIYYTSVRNWDKAIETAEMWARSYPRSHTAHIQAGLNHWNQGELDDALREQLEAYRIEPRNAIAHACLVWVYKDLDRFDEAKRIAGIELAQNPDEPGLHYLLVLIAYIQGDKAAADRQIQSSAGKQMEFVVLQAQADSVKVLGRMRDGEKILRRANDLLEQRRLTPTPVTSSLEQALIGNCVRNGTEINPSVTALTLCEDAAATALALKRTEEEAAKQPGDMFVRAIRLPMMRAALELKHDQPARSIELLQPVMHYERRYPEVIYLRGLSYLRFHKGTEAAAEFRKIVDHKGDNWGPFYAPSFVGLARGAALAGDTAQARKAYQDFFALWKDADPGIPLLNAARKEYAALN